MDGCSVSIQWQQLAALESVTWNLARMEGDFTSTNVSAVDQGRTHGFTGSVQCFILCVEVHSLLSTENISDSEIEVGLMTWYSRSLSFYLTALILQQYDNDISLPISLTHIRLKDNRLINVSSEMKKKCKFPWIELSVNHAKLKGSKAVSDWDLGGEKSSNSGKKTRAKHMQTKTQNHVQLLTSLSRHNTWVTFSNHLFCCFVDFTQFNPTCEL